MSKKITLKEFFDSEERLAIHCHTEEKANKLLKEFDKLGKVWRDGDKYIEKNDYMINNNSTCYDNEGEFSNLGYYLNRNYKIYEFDDIIFEEQSKNLIPFIAEKLGVEIGQRFKVDTTTGVFYFDNDYLNYEENNEEDIYFAHQKSKATLEELLNGHWKITEKLSKAPRLSEQEYWVLKGLKDYKYLIRDIVGDMNVQKNVSENIGDDWDYMCPYNHLFKFVKKDQKPHNIQELIKEYEELLKGE